MKGTALLLATLMWPFLSEGQYGPALELGLRAGSYFVPSALGDRPYPPLIRHIGVVQTLFFGKAAGLSLSYSMWFNSQRLQGIQSIYIEGYREETGNIETLDTGTVLHRLRYRQFEITACVQRQIAGSHCFYGKGGPSFAWG